jgi:hypothetical protein
MTQSNEAEKSSKPHDVDAGTADRVEKKPKQPESPRQNHNDEDHG